MIVSIIREEFSIILSSFSPRINTNWRFLVSRTLLLKVDLHGLSDFGASETRSFRRAVSRNRSFWHSFPKNTLNFGISSALILYRQIAFWAGFLSRWHVFGSSEMAITVSSFKTAGESVRVCEEILLLRQAFLLNHRHELDELLVAFDPIITAITYIYSHFFSLFKFRFFFVKLLIFIFHQL